MHKDFVSGLGQICVVTAKDDNDGIPEIVLVEVKEPTRKIELLLQWAVEQQEATSTTTQQKVSQKKQIVGTKDSTVAASATVVQPTKSTQVSQSNSLTSTIPKTTKEASGQPGVSAGPPIWKPPVGVNIQSLYVSVLHRDKYLPMYANTAVGVPFVNDLFEGQVRAL